MKYITVDMNKRLISTLAITLVGFSLSAQAITTGSTQFSSFGSTATLSKNSLVFSPQQSGFGTLESQTGDFVGLSAVSFQEIVKFTPDTVVDENPFMDFGLATDTPAAREFAAGFGIPFPKDANGNYLSGPSLNDDINGFNLERSFYQIGKIEDSIEIDIYLDGYFNAGVDTKTANGIGIITLQTLNIDSQGNRLFDNKQQIENYLNADNSFSGMTFSGATITVTEVTQTGNTVENIVPEPSTYAMFGIAFSILGFVGYRKRRAA